MPDLPADRTPTAQPAVAAHAEPAVVHRGRFVHAVCERCGWRGPARRALASTATDGHAHAEQQHG